MGVFLSTMDSSMINVALPSIMRSFGTSLPQTEWVVLIYLLTITVFLLFWGRIADSLGLSSVYIVGMAVFSVGSVACYFSVTLVQLIAFRFIQAMGASMMMATGPAIIKMVFPIDQLGKALGLIGVSTSVGLMTGPLISGFLIHSYSWREIFLVTLPVSLFACGAGLIFLKPFASQKVFNKARHPFDWAGMTLWAALISLAVFLSTNHIGVSAEFLVVEAFLCLVLFLLFARTEARKENPLFPISLFHNHSFGIAIFCAALSFAVLFVVLILTPFYLDYVLSLSAKDIGFVMMALPISVFFVSPLSGFLYNHIGARFLTTSGLTIAACGLILLCFLTTESSSFDVAWRLAVLGCGQALFLTPNSATVLENVGPGQTGVSSGMLATARNLGMLIGVSLAGLLFGVIFSRVSGGFDLKQYNPCLAENFMYALKMTFAITASISIFGAVLSSLRRNVPLTERS
ncbi:MFS transporter [Desulfocapsa sulfexigens]|nr:MFS transporter [Desulfocapsa sulfexigens]